MTDTAYIVIYGTSSSCLNNTSNYIRYSQNGIY